MVCDGILNHHRPGAGGDRGQQPDPRHLSAGAVSQGDDGGRLTVLGSTSFLDGEDLAASPSLANQTLFVNAVTAGFDDMSNWTIPAKSLAAPYNTVRNPGLWSAVYILILPAGILLWGFLFWLKRRKL